MSWTVEFYSDDVENEILNLQAGFVARFLRYAERMELYCCQSENHNASSVYKEVSKDA